MLRDSHSRSAHRANPGSGLAIQALVRVTAPAQHRRPHRAAVVIPRMRTPERHAPRRRANPARPSLADRLLVTARSAAAARVRPQDETTQRLWPRAVVRGVPRRPGGPLHPLAQPQQALQLLLSGLGALIMTSIVVLTLFFVIAEESRGPVDGSSASPGIAAEAISSRDVDTAPLTRGEVFGTPEIRLAAGSAPYRVTMTHTDTDCGVATTGDVGGVLSERGCSQVVRAAMVAPYGGYRVTAGIFNLPDAASAEAAGDDIQVSVESGRGSFAALDTGDAPATPLTQVGWHDRGHYLLYCVISRPDGSLVADDDPYAEQITVDLVEHYLAQDVLGKRSVSP
ncbi:hypothetical protein [Actinoplanes sp. NPDC049681]|uniref:hypothetical protein n=1 Tax=Actinoplanes sp. NPDC049681 TaxID=3363905 RepID=UPI0037A5B0F2